MDDRNILDSGEKAEMRGLVLAGAARADSIRRHRSRIAASVSAVVVVAGIAVGAGFASGMLGRGSVAPAVPAPASSASAQTPDGASPYDGVVAFERARTAQDELPMHTPEDAFQNVKPETSRYIGTRDNVAYWIAQGTESGSICVVVSAVDRTDWFSGCGGIAPWGYWVKTGAPGLAEAQLGPAGAAPDGWIELDENLSVNPNP